MKNNFIVHAFADENHSIEVLTFKTTEAIQSIIGQVEAKYADWKSIVVVDLLDISDSTIFKKSEMGLTVDLDWHRECLQADLDSYHPEWSNPATWDEATQKRVRELAENGLFVYSKNGKVVEF